MQPVKLIVVGAGARGTTYASYAEAHPDRLQIVGVADPREFYRRTLAEKYQIPAENMFADWTEVAARPKFADGVIIATPDALHTEPAIAFANLGYHILLEKPMAPTAEECKRIVAAVEANGVTFAVCHVLRYTTYTRKLKEIIDSGAIGELISVQHLEPVGFWHQAHSFVRGNWRNQKESSFMLLAKSCHDIDWLAYIVGEECQEVSSFGSLKHFRRDQQPQGAADRCLDCAVEAQCPYSAVRIYLKACVERGYTGWPAAILTTDLTHDGVMQALREGPYGRCVYACDNDVVDNQVVNLRYANERTAVFTMTAFTRMAARKTRIFGTRGELYGDSDSIEHYDFLSDTTTTIDTREEDAGIVMRGHGGGDYYLMDGFVKAILTGDRSGILSGPQETLKTHLTVFAAEEARLKHQVMPVA